MNELVEYARRLAKHKKSLGAYDVVKPLNDLCDAIEQLRRQHVHCERCGGTWLADGTNSGCHCEAVGVVEAIEKLTKEYDQLLLARHDDGYYTGETERDNFCDLFGGPTLIEALTSAVKAKAGPDPNPIIDSGGILYPGERLEVWPVPPLAVEAEAEVERLRNSRNYLLQAVGLIENPTDAQQRLIEKSDI